MKKRKLMPYIFIVSLLLILAFLGGTKYGKDLERTNKVIDLFTKITPPVTSEPTKPVERGFKLYENATCGISFAYPSYLSIEEESSSSASFISADNETVDISCEPDYTLPEAFLQEEKIATTSLELNDEPVLASVSAVKEDEKYSFSLRNAKKRLDIDILISSSLYPLFAQSVKIE